MIKFVAKRVGISFLILLVSSALVFVLVINSGDPLQDLRESNNKNRENLMRQRIQIMGLEYPWYIRYWHWLRGVAGCFKGACDLGRSRTGQSVNSLLEQAAGSTIRLVLLATILAIVLGIFFGIMTAIRQYSGFDYAVTFIAFVLYSLPSFVFAVLLKQFGAIRLNQWLDDPTISITTSLILAAIIGFAIQSVFGGNYKRRLLTGGISFVVILAVAQYVSITRWAIHPTVSWFGPALTGLGAAVLFTSLMAGLSNRQVLISAIAGQVVTLFFLIAVGGTLWQPTWLLLFLYLVISVVIGGAIGRFFGGYANRAAMWIGIWSSFSMFLATCMNYALAYWSDYLQIAGKAISTIGSQTPNFAAKNVFWLQQTDTITHLILPTVSLTLLSFAGYTRYTRSSMLEVLSQDYIRTARAKGLPERMVIMRHGFRNSMIPITTIVAFDFAGLIGGALITENVFGWKGMGQLFQTGLQQVDPAPVMAYFLVTGAAAVMMNMIADIMYAYIDPRIRR